MTDAATDCPSPDGCPYCREFGCPRSSTLITPKAADDKASIEHALGLAERDASLRGVDVTDPAAIGHYRTSWLGKDGHDMAPVNYNSLRRLIALIDQLAVMVTTPKAWTPIGWSPPFRADGTRVLDSNGRWMCSSFTPDAAETASALNIACQAGAVSEWRPIDDDTPRDGTPIIVGRRDDSFGWIWGTAVWFGHAGVAGWVSRGNGSEVADGLGLANPTHWMPPPPPPETGGR